MTATSDVLTGIAQLIAGAGIATWNPTGSYALTDTGILMKIMADGTGVPDRVVVLNLIPLTDEVSNPLGRSMLQVAGRGLRNDPLDVDALMDPIFDLLHGRTGDVFGTVTVVQMFRTSSVPMGEDALTRSERADKFYLDIAAAPTALRPAGGSW
ncbi:MAG: hypothetical protein B7X07_06370 [Actinobacteria bacterium 21-64-8]|nr:MAG: hypothetical protein B7X07_06370 [Actinobacteria bacterium 21-64-8]